MNNGISNFRTDRFFKKEDHEELKKIIWELFL